MCACIVCSSSCLHKCVMAKGVAASAAWTPRLASLCLWCMLLPGWLGCTTESVPMHKNTPQPSASLRSTALQAAAQCMRTRAHPYAWAGPCTRTHPCTNRPIHTHTHAPISFTHACTTVTVRLGNALACVQARMTSKPPCPPHSCACPADKGPEFPPSLVTNTGEWAHFTAFGRAAAARRAPPCPRRASPSCLWSLCRNILLLLFLDQALPLPLPLPLLVCAYRAFPPCLWSLCRNMMLLPLLGQALPLPCRCPCPCVHTEPPPPAFGRCVAT